MRTSIIGIVGMLMLSVLLVGTVAGVPPLIPSSEQRIASMQINRSTGNMTGDDYLVAFVFAYINDSMKYGVNSQSNPEYEALFKEAATKFPEYNLGGWSPVGVIGDTEIGWKVTHVVSEVVDNDVNSDGSVTSKPLQGYIDKVIDDLFQNGETGYDIPRYLITPRIQVYARLKEEAKQKEMHRQEEAKQLAAQQLKEAKQRADQQANMTGQLAFDAHYKNISENYTANLTILVNQSKFTDALNLSNEAIKNLVSPYSNIMMISKGDIFTSMGRYEDAIGTYQNAQKEFKYDNESIDYQNKIYQDFGQEWNTIVAYKINLAQQKLNDQITAKKHNLRNAPNVMQLLRGHDGGRKYSVNVENDSYVGGGYIVSINLSAINKPLDLTNKTDAYIKVNDDTKAFVPSCIDMLGGLFADKRIARVCIQNNETYLDRFGHKNEVAVWSVCMNNGTATRVGNWNDFKQYVGTDMNKLSSVASVSSLNRGE